MRGWSSQAEGHHGTHIPQLALKLLQAANLMREAALVGVDINVQLRSVRYKTHANGRTNIEELHHVLQQQSWVSRNDG